MVDLAAGEAPADREVESETSNPDARGAEARGLSSACDERWPDAATPWSSCDRPVLRHDHRRHRAQCCRLRRSRDGAPRRRALVEDRALAAAQPRAERTDARRRQPAAEPIYRAVGDEPLTIRVMSTLMALLLASLVRQVVAERREWPGFARLAHARTRSSSWTALRNRRVRARRTKSPLRAAGRHVAVASRGVAKLYGLPPLPWCGRCAEIRR